MDSIPHRRRLYSSIKACVHCGVTFTISNPNQYFCGESCRLQHRFGPPRPCAQCAREFQPRWSGNEYCGTACHDMAQRRGPDLICEHCGAAFRRRDTISKAYRPRFCSRACRLASTVHTYTCPQCGSAFTRRTPSNTSKFCGAACAVDARRSPTPRSRQGYDKRYDTWRAAVVARDRACRHCGATKDLHAHHIRSWADCPTLRYALDNGLLLCAACHQLRHPERGVGGRRVYGR